MSTETARQIEHVVGLLLLLSDEDRMEVFGEFCVYCGTADPKCQCWNDE